MTQAGTVASAGAYGRGTTAYERGFRARWGYRQLVESDEHRDGLEERDPVALVIFGEQLDQLEGGRMDQMFDVSSISADSGEPLARLACFRQNRAP